MPPAEPPTSPGGYIEPNYHFTSAGPPSPLFDNIIAVMQELFVDVNEAGNFCFKAVFYRHAGRISVKVSVFTLPGLGRQKYAVEFQRRSVRFLSQVMKQETQKKASLAFSSCDRVT